MVRLLLDEHVGRVFEHVLAQRGHDVVQAKDRFGERTSDAALLDWCVENDAVVVTNNARDFEPLHERREHRGLFLYRRQDLPDIDPEGLATAIDTVLDQYGEDVTGRLVELDDWYDWLHE